jgi:hypothetical protein
MSSRLVRSTCVLIADAQQGSVEQVVEDHDVVRREIPDRVDVGRTPRLVRVA